MSDAPEAGWTDLHFHPIDAAWRPEPADLPALLRALGIETIGHAVVHAAPDLWDAEGDPGAPLAEREGPLVDEVPELAATDGAAVLSLLCDPVACGWGELLRALHSPRDPWRPCVLSVGWGETSIPDPKLEKTAARFAFSLAIGGPGLPKKTDTAATTIPKLPLVVAAIERLSAATGTPCAAHLAYGDGWA